MPASRSRDYGLVLLASVLWGTSFPGTKVTVGTVDPLFLTFARMGVFVAGVIWAFYVVGAKRLVDRGGDYVALTAGILSTTALLATIPLFFVRWPLPTNASGWLGIAYLGLVPTFTPLMLYVASMRTISPTISGILILLEVVVAAILSFVFLQDALSAYTVAGGAMILLGAFVVTRGEASIPEPATGGFSPVPHDSDGPGFESKPRP